MYENEIREGIKLFEEKNGRIPVYVSVNSYLKSKIDWSNIDIQVIDNEKLPNNKFVLTMEPENSKYMFICKIYD